MLWLLFSVVPVLSQNCSSSDTFCSKCAIVGNVPGAKALYTQPFCSVLFNVNDGSNTIDNTVPRCEEAFNFTGTTAVCQLPVFPDASLGDTYAKAGLRDNQRSYFLGLVRGENCSSSWFYEAADGNRFYGGNFTENPPCSATRGVFEQTRIVQVDPNSYKTNSFLCQCAETIKNLPGTKSAALFSFAATAFLLLLCLWL